MRFLSPFRFLMLPCLLVVASMSVGTFAQSGPREQNKVSLLLPDNTLTVLTLETGTVKSNEAPPQTDKVYCG